MYFEDALWMEDTFWKNAIGTSYLTMGLCGISMNLMIVSIIPEIGEFLSRPLALLASCQLFISIVQLTAVFIPVPYMIATNKPYFLNEIIINFPGSILLTMQLASLLVQFFSTVYRNLSVLSENICEKLFHDWVVYLMLAISISYPIYHAASLSIETTIHRFSLETLGFSRSEIEIISVITFVAVVALFALMFYILAFSDLIYRTLFDPDDGDDKESSTCSELATTLAFLVSDVIYSFLICLPRIFDPWLQSFVNVFAVALWPSVTLISYDLHVQAAFAFRVRGMFQSCGGGGGSGYSNPPIIRAKKRKREPRLRIL
ncbi:unnamed protein product [Caenorhabditis auriculariae]|uniref:Uncharacterized protein n=1 Tax=Caenorhabditis auriculariae TaxID=2777116 RepID=A0A8S1HJG4_9PELO|nr:unnamed protein product [Caenorhabditis auriculariae]